jgi:hypothetical protein
MFVAAGDGRGPWARRRRDLEALFADDMGGASILTEFQLSLVATAATLRLELERMEGRMSMGEVVDIDRYDRAAGSVSDQAPFWKMMGSSVDAENDMRGMDGCEAVPLRNQDRIAGCQGSKDRG